MTPFRMCLALVLLGGWIVGAAPQPGGDGGALRQSLPRVTDLPPGYRPIGALGGRGPFYAAGSPLHRVDDGDQLHGMPATVAWAASPKDEDARRRGLLYGVDRGRVTAADISFDRPTWWPAGASTACPCGDSTSRPPAS